MLLVYTKTYVQSKPSSDFAPRQWSQPFFAYGPPFQEIYSNSNGSLCYADTSWTTSRNCIAHRWYYIIYCAVKVTHFRNILSRICGTLCGPLEIPGGPPVVHLDHFENYFSKTPTPEGDLLHKFCAYKACVLLSVNFWATNWRMQVNER